MRKRSVSDEILSNYKPKTFSFSVVVKFIILNLLYGGIAFLVRNIILSAIAESPSHKLGNEIISLYEVHNTGAAFNLFQNQSEMIIVASFTAIIVLSFIVFVSSSKLSSTLLSSISFLTSGITLNLIDRTTLGYVVDYIQLGIIPAFPIFNMADIMIVAGALGILSAVLTRK